MGKARQELYRAQCNCPWWHGTFGGIYLPHLRGAVYEHLIAAENLLLEATPRTANWVEGETADLNLDGTPEVCLSNAQLAAYFHPASGGCLYELDVRNIRHNLLATLARRPEAYHDAIRNHHGQTWKQGGLDHMLQYDEYLRKSMIDHFYEPGVTLDHLATRQERERGDFVTALTSIVWIASTASCASSFGARVRLTGRVCASPRKFPCAVTATRWKCATFWRIARDKIRYTSPLSSTSPAWRPVRTIAISITPASAGGPTANLSGLAQYRQDRPGR